MAQHQEREHYEETSSLSSLKKEKEDTLDHSPIYDDLHPPAERATTNRTTHSHTHMDVPDFANLPYRTFSSSAEVEQEYVEEHEGGQVLKSVKSNKTGRIERYEFVTWTIKDPENPKNWSKAYKWWCTMTVAVTCFVVAFNSAVITADISGPAKAFRVSEEVSLLAITVFVIGFGVGK